MALRLCCSPRTSCHGLSRASTSINDALDRYQIIRNFFREQKSTSSSPSHHSREVYLSLDREQTYGVVGLEVRRKWNTITGKALLAQPMPFQLQKTPKYSTIPTDRPPGQGNSRSYRIRHHYIGGSRFSLSSNFINIRQFHATSSNLKKRSGTSQGKGEELEAGGLTEGRANKQVLDDEPKPAETIPPPPQIDSQTPTESAEREETISTSNQLTSPSKKEEPKPFTLPYNFENYSKFFRRLALAAPHLHRPTRDDFLRLADGFWQGLRVRFKWFTIRSFRKFNADDISGIMTWILMSQTIWILIGTTTFFSVVFAVANSLRLQNFIARGISDYLTSETGVTVIFESAIVPKWKDSRISFKNVYVSRRPSSSPQQKKIKEHQAGLGYDVSHHPAYHHIGGEDEDEETASSEEDGNYTQFDLDIGSIDVTLSLKRWLDGKGLIESAAVKGVRGVLDRRSVQYDPDNPLDPAQFRHTFHPGDFELESLQLEDVLITVHQPGGFRPYTASIFRADIGMFRKRYLFYDFLRAENIVGQYDGCLFSLHKPQSIGRTTEMDLQDGEWARMSRIRIDGVKIDHLQSSTSYQGPVSWITSGKLDAVFDIKFPKDPEDGLPFNALLEEIADAISTTVLSSTPDPILQRIPGQRELAKPPLSAPPKAESEKENSEPKVVIDIDLRFRDVKAAVPIFTNDLSYVNNAVIRPIVAFMNANRTLVPIHCRVVKPLSDFDGAYTMWEAGLMDEISIKIYDALAYHVTQVNMNRRIKTVSVWSLQMTVNAVLAALRNLVDPVSIRLREAYLKRIEEGGMFVFSPDTLPVI